MSDPLFYPIHQHLLIKAYVDKPQISTIEGQIFLLDVVKALGMEPVTSPQAYYVDTPGNEGLTGSINLATSHVAFHVWDRTGLMMMDVYSCCAFDAMEVFTLLNEYFEAYEISHTTIDRFDYKLYDKDLIIE